MLDDSNSNVETIPDPEPTVPERPCGNWKLFLAAALVLLMIGTVLFSLLGLGEKEGVQAPSPQDVPTLSERVDAIIATRDIGQCDTITDAEFVTICKNNIYLQLATEHKDPTYCDKTDGAMLSSTECKRIAGLQDQIDCLTLTDPLQQKNCQFDQVMGMVYSSGDISLCAQVADAELASLCHNRYVISQSVPGQYICTDLQGELVQKDCEIINAAVDEPDAQLGLCAVLQSQEFSSFCPSNN